MSTTVAVAILAISFVVLMVLRFPIALVLAISSLLTMAYMGVPLAALGQRMIQGLNSYGLLAIPFFILAGQIMSEGGLARRLVNLAQLFVGFIRGGLALVSCVACMFFGNISGSAVADVSSVGSVMIPMMKKKGYDADYSVGVTTSAAIQGVVMPPSHNMILYALAAGGISISQLFLAGIVPCLILLAALMTTSYIIARKRGYEKGEAVPLRQVPRIVLDGLLSVLTGVIILWGIFSGLFTATESGALACVYAYFVTFVIYRDLPFSHTLIILRKTFRTVLMVLFLIAASSAFGWVLAYLRIPNMVTDALLGLTDNPIVILLIINVLLLVLGAPMDMAPLILIMTPILFPVVTALGMDPIHFGVVMILNLGIGLITPPVGTVLFVGCALGRIPIGAGARASIPFFFTMVGVLLLLTYVPGIVMWLPNLVGGGS